MEFKKSDSNQIEMVMAGIICIMLILLPVTYMLEWFGYIPYGWASSAEIIMTVGGAILLLFVIMYLLKPENRFFSLLDVFLILEAVSFLISTLFARDPNLALVGSEFSMEGTIINLVYLLLIFSCSMLKNRKHRVCVYGALILVALFEAFMGFMQTVVRYGLLLGVPEIMEQINYRAYGTMMNQNPYGAFMAIFAALEFGLLITAKKKAGIVIHAVLAVIFSCCVMFSGTRGSMLGLAFAIFFYGILILIGKYRKQEAVKGVGKRYGIVILLAVISVGLATILSADTAQNTVDRVMSEVQNTSADAIGSGRVGLWKQVLTVWKQSIVTGVGVGNFKLFSFTGSGVSIVDVAHNEFLDILVTRGLVGIVTYLSLMLYLFIFAMKKMYKNGIRKSGELFGLLIAFVTYMATAFFGWRIIYLTPYFYVLSGLMVSRNESKRICLKKK